MSTLDSLLEMAVQAAAEAGDRIMEVYAGHEFGITWKPDESPLTLADQSAHDAITQVLKQTGIPVLSEEGSEIAFAERSKWKLFWLVDPLDGTKEFINRNGDFTVNIALIEDGHPVLGVIVVPVERKLYYGLRGTGAFRIDAYGDESLPENFRKKIRRVRLPEKPDERNYTVVGSRSHMNDETTRFIGVLQMQYPDLCFQSRGSSLKFCLLAEGKADLYPRFGPTMEWDTAAGHALVLAAGFEVVHTDGNSPLMYNKKSLLNPWFLVKLPDFVVPAWNK
jgi:3'(2'), 5'-bisphosphate nucleotidase